MASEKDIQKLLEEIDLRDGWEVRRQEQGHLVIDYRPAPMSRLKRRQYPGIDITDVGPIWWVGSTDNIGEGFEPGNEDTRPGGKSIDCADFEDAVSLVEHGMKKVETAVGEELREAHEPKLLPDGGVESGEGVYQEIDGMTLSEDLTATGLQKQAARRVVAPLGMTDAEDLKLASVSFTFVGPDGVSRTWNAEADGYDPDDFEDGLPIDGDSDE